MYGVTNEAFINFYYNINLTASQEQTQRQKHITFYVLRCITYTLHHVHRPSSERYLGVTHATEVTRSTRRAQTSMAEADHYSHIAHCKNVEPWL